MSTRVGVLLGILASLIAAGALAAVITRSARAKDIVAVIPTQALIVPRAAPTRLHVRIAQGTDLGRISADFDGVAIAAVPINDGLDIGLDRLQPGAHLLRVGVIYRGQVERIVHVPVIAGPFASRVDWIENAITLAIASSEIDDHRAATRDDLAGALGAFILRRLGHHAVLGTMRSCVVSLRPTDDGLGVTVRGNPIYDNGGVDFSLELRFARPSPTRITLTPTNVHATPDARTLAHAHELVTSLVGAVGAITQAFTGHNVIDTRARQLVDQTFVHLIGNFLPAGNAIELPDSVPLGEAAPGARLELRFRDAPRFGTSSGMTLELDARVISPTASLAVGPLQFAPLPVEFPSATTTSHVRISAPLIGALADAFANGGRLEASLNETIAALPPGSSPIRIRAIHLASPLLLQRGPPGAAGWSMADVALDAPVGSDAKRTIRAFVTGSLTAALTDDRTRIHTRIRVANVTVSCRQQDATGWQFSPCLSDVVSAGVDIPQRINRAMEPMNLFGDQLGALTGLSFQGVLAVNIIPQTVVVGDASGVPSVIATADVNFSVHDRAPAH